MSERIKEILIDFGKGCSNGRAGECSDCLDGAVSAIMAQVGWQAIETAPKDGTPVILSYDGKIGVFAWVKPEINKIRRIPYPNMWLGYRVMSRAGKDDEFRIYDSQAINPTGWMPFPEPPMK